LSVHVRLTWEHTHRELLPALLFLHRARASGLDAELAHVRRIERNNRDEQVVFLPFYYDDTDREKYLWAGYEGRWIVNMCYEQMHFRCGRDYLLPRGSFSREQMLFCTWGPRFRELLIERGIPSERTRVVGHPRFDIYREPKLLMSRQELAVAYGLDADKPWILVPYNFNLAYISDGLRESLVARGYALTQDFIDGVAQARDAFTVMVRSLCDEFPGLEIILRVHPAGYEASTIYKDEPRLRGNLHVIADFDIAHWITQSDLTIVWNSTTSMEVMVAGRPVISYEPYPFSEVFDFDVNRIVPTMQTVEEVFSVVSSLPQPELAYDWDLFERWYAFRDGQNTQRLADIALEADRDYASYACTAPDGSLRRRLQRLQKGAERRLKPPRVHPDPDRKALDRAIDDLDPRHLGDFLR